MSKSQIPEHFRSDVDTGRAQSAPRYGQHARPQVKAGLPTSYDHNQRFEIRERDSTPPTSWPKAVAYDPLEEMCPSPVALRTYKSPMLFGNRL